MSNINNIMASKAKNLIPLTALLVNSTDTPFAADTGPVVFLFYVAQNNLLASKQFISRIMDDQGHFLANRIFEYHIRYYCRQSSASGDLGHKFRYSGES